MKKIKFSKLLKQDNVAIHTPTEEQAKSLLKELDKKGYTWRNGTKLTDITCYEDEKENTCYSFYYLYGILRNKKVLYGSLDFYQEECYTIIEFSDIDFKENKIK